MADKAISELTAANQVTPTDLFVLEQSGTAKKLTGQVLENWLLSFADGHGGIQSIALTDTIGLKDTYTITFADNTKFTFDVTNGRGIVSVKKSNTSGLVDTYLIVYNEGKTDSLTVTNGAKGDKGDNTYTHIKFASQEPTEESHSFGDIPDQWIGLYWGDSSTAPTDWTQYKWYQFKGDKGDTGSPATLTSAVVEYQVSNSGTVIPSGAWNESVPSVAQGKYLWTRTTQTFNSGSPVVSYSVSRMGLDGAGSVVSVNNVSPDAEGNVVLTPEDVGARPNTWVPTVEEIGTLPALESADCPGSYYRRTESGAVEWINPPMEYGVEYRTTELWMHHPVYVKAFMLGNLPNATTANVTLGMKTGEAHIIDSFGFKVGPNDGSARCVPFPWSNDVAKEYGYIITASNGNFICSVFTTSNQSEYSGVVVVKYWKTAD